MIYYIDMQNGTPDADGRTPERARSSYTDLPLCPGDRVLFRRGNVIRDVLYRKPGTPEAYITYGAYGEGDAPMFVGSVDVSCPGDWKEVRPNVWQYQRHLESEACNFIFDNGRIGGTLRWQEDALSMPGDWYDSRMGTHGAETAEEEKVLLFSFGNPGTCIPTSNARCSGNGCFPRISTARRSRTLRSAEAAFTRFPAEHGT